MTFRAARSIAVSLALCAMLLRALLPDGWMPAANAAAAGTPFVICSVDADHHGGKAPGDTQQRTHAPCAFAAMAPLSPPCSAAIPVRIACDVSVIARRAYTARTVDRPAYRRNAPRAPPLLSEA